MTVISSSSSGTRLKGFVKGDRYGKHTATYRRCSGNRCDGSGRIYGKRAFREDICAISRGFHGYLRYADPGTNCHCPNLSGSIRCETINRAARDLEIGVVSVIACVEVSVTVNGALPPIDLSGVSVSGGAALRTILTTSCPLSGFVPVRVLCKPH